MPICKQCKEFSFSRGLCSSCKEGKITEISKKYGIEKSEVKEASEMKFKTVKLPIAESKNKILCYKEIKNRAKLLQSTKHINSKLI